MVVCIIWKGLLRFIPTAEAHCKYLGEATLRFTILCCILILNWEPFRVRKIAPPVRSLYILRTPWFYDSTLFICYELFHLNKCLLQGRNEIPFILNSKSYRDLKIRVKKAIPYPFATFEWYFKASLIFGLAVFLEFESLQNGPSLFKALVLGVVMAMIGLCIQHESWCCVSESWTECLGQPDLGLHPGKSLWSCAPDVKGNNVVVFPRTGSAAACCFGSTTLCFCITHTKT